MFSLLPKPRPLPSCKTACFYLDLRSDFIELKQSRITYFWHQCLLTWFYEISCVCASNRAPMVTPSCGRGVSQLSLPTSFSPILVCPACRNLSPILLFTHQFHLTYLQFSYSDCHVCLHWPITCISLFYKSSFCHFSFSLRSIRDPAYLQCGATFVVRGWDPGDWGYCWAAAPQCQCITFFQDFELDRRLGRPSWSVGWWHLSCWGVYQG